MAITLHKICECLRVQYRHHELWLDWREWPAGQVHPDMAYQPVVTSCSGRHLAAWSGAGESWSFLLDRTQLRFDDDEDCFRPARNTEHFLSDSSIAELKEQYRF